MRKRAFGELELAILNVIKTRGKVTVREVVEALDNDNVYTTIMTVMNRLVEKGELHRHRVGRHYEYWQESGQVPSKLTLLNRLKNKIFGGNSAAMVSYLIESDEEITEEELFEIEQLIRKARGTE